MQPPYNTYYLLPTVIRCYSSSYPSRGEVGESVEGDGVIGLDLVVIGLVGEGEGKHTLLLQVGLVDAGERLGDNCGATQESGKFKCTWSRLGLSDHYLVQYNGHHEKSSNEESPKSLKLKKYAL